MLPSRFKAPDNKLFAFRPPFAPELSGVALVPGRLGLKAGLEEKQTAGADRISETGEICASIFRDGDGDHSAIRNLFLKQDLSTNDSKGDVRRCSCGTQLDPEAIAENYLQPPIRLRMELSFTNCGTVLHTSSTARGRNALSRVRLRLRRHCNRGRVRGHRSTSHPSLLVWRGRRIKGLHVSVKRK
jgi:hypothetical protein